MPQYLVANYLPDDFDPSAVTEAMIEEIHALNREMIAAGARKFACGISPASTLSTLESFDVLRSSGKSKAQGESLRALGNGSLDSGEPRSGDRELMNPGSLTTSNPCRPYGAGYLWVADARFGKPRLG